MRYLYGLSIQGIQGYIFATNKLKEIVGASILVIELPKKLVEDVLGKEISETNILLDAAGNFKCIFEDEASLKKVFLEIPKKFQEHAGELEVSQAFIPIENLEKESVGLLENKLRTQRNLPKNKRPLAFMAMEKNAKTGLPKVATDGDDDLDQNQKLKREAKKKESKSFDFFDLEPKHSFTDEIEKLTSDEYENWIAVIHADGNGLGKLVRDLADKEGPVQENYREFSNNIGTATKNAVKQAFEATVKNATPIEVGNYPFRPIIVGGDDVTVIVRADVALDFTSKFLECFEEETEKLLKKKLTACAGIAYVKSHYPFHYGATLAEELCKEAKEDARPIDNDTPPSCIMFHRVQSSFVRKWKIIQKEELMAGNISLQNGPYYIHECEGKSTVDELKKYAEKMHEANAPKSAIRQWLTELGKDQNRAKNLMARTCKITTSDYVKSLKLQFDSKEGGKTHLYDVLVIEDLTMKNQ